MGRPKSAYDWEGKKAALYELYITENKSMDEVLALQPETSSLPRYAKHFYGDAHRPTLHLLHLLL